MGSTVQRQVSKVHKQQLQAVCALGCVHGHEHAGGHGHGHGYGFCAASCSFLGVAMFTFGLCAHPPRARLSRLSSLARVRASRRVISRAFATIRASHVVASRHLSNRTLHTLQFFQCQSDGCRLARQCEHTRTVVGWPSSIRYTKATRRGSVESRSNHERASPQALCPNLGGLHDVNVIRLSTLHEYAAVLHSPSVSICGDGDAPPSQLSLVRRGPQPCWPKAELQHWHLTASRNHSRGKLEDN